ncbi:23S rRNA (pseudouridine(1915)-N(3))-methyltransferase RlmH [Helicobacter anatolicus]|uniref:23S rRNA (pseudouridine(1915)-N(3))-methyltransferase RlmH n=1 Tax=Helicobacter anatolicus TaxID=2905874 RepID=UPI001E39CBAC|nr:23S rRNA (pseudouridine(1915)-N(3))-methyltransferase RlmH [Helicobacter anatolicus]MCE3038559.1 23S rRNA (pseudouridine(1915)-N(3))-methyltransferase RlmH [Helicobacter anatolicus]
MKINLYCIAKKEKEDDFIVHYQKLCKQFGAELKIFNLFNTEVLQAQKKSAKEAQSSYTKILSPYLSKNHTANNIALHPDAKTCDSFIFSKMLDCMHVNFFIGGSFGFEENFLKETRTLSLSKLTMSHKIAKIVLCEQIYRGLSILHKHPYHK